MPLIIMTGIPSSGKTHRTLEIKKYFEEERKKTVHVVSEFEAVTKSGYSKNDIYLDAQKEKIVRGILKSEVFRLLTKDNVVILDGGNYIKGYRYELYCGSKAARVPQCTIWTSISKDDAWKFNQNSNLPYTKEVFDELCFRYEEPNPTNRWDSPLFAIFPEDECKFDEIYISVFEKKPPAPNLSTQNPPLSAPNFLYEMDKITQDIVGNIITNQKMGNSGPYKLPGNKSVVINYPSDITIGQLSRLRRQFLTYSKMHTNTSSIEKIPQLFAQFLNSNLN
ncbi:protein KTI12 homolog [Ctenocephalides felis]|uniref:protein KTI12 homolog n=1 Tax=Ctenocephalides felis TaxID=7515 RepID=UPI000E6E37FD|nr:protein KTI12 homolog [Ctenocephalides felis]